MPPSELRGNARWSGSRNARMLKWRREQEWKTVGFGDGAALLSERGHVPLGRVRITYVFVKPGVMDINNFVAGMKYYEDGLVAAGLIVDDDSRVVTYGEHRHEKPARGEKPRTEVLIEVVRR